ncbi:pyridoxal-phosphate dependent enzyme [Lysinibacillus yapensis]|uniref:Cysteine synthase n=1 Tax=Ureibacillus yapensis TaxID=2304605 RepID=A0A396S4X0_9BACL|nr:pyridoxal-phosphate dependent enzyme [Lysinibacillus yapensis]RHW34736.1 pyridoxal-phosphate dependent enzyme [Lysinibacillus yapensis]
MSLVSTKAIKTSIIQLIGNTPLLQLVNLEKQLGLQAEIVAKLEYFNPANSIKDRVAASMIEQAEKNGDLTKEHTIVETTSGNTGIGLAAIAAAKGYKLKVYIQDNVSEERTKVIKAYGAEVIPFSEVPELAAVAEEIDGDFVAAINIFKKEVVDKQENVVFLNQLNNQGNPQVHFDTTGPEIWRDTDGQVDIVIASVGTGGTISGIGGFLKEKNPNIQIIAVEPGLNSIASIEEPEIPEITGVHRFSDIEDERVPDNVNRSVIDEVISVETEQANQYARLVARLDGILVGTSSGGILSAAIEVAKRSENEGKRIVVILPDTGLRYLSTDLFN